MARIIELKTHKDDRGSLTVAELGREIPFEPKRLFYIYGEVSDVKRGGHRHHKNIQALICLAGSCRIFSYDGKTRQTFDLNRPDKCLILEPVDWHTMYDFSSDAVLLVLASEHYDVNDYIDEEYK